MTRNIDRSTPVSLLRAGAAALLLGSVLAACSGAASTPGSAVATSGAVGATAPASAPAVGNSCMQALILWRGWRLDVVATRESLEDGNDP